MGIGFYLSIAMLPVMIIFIIIFFSKKKIANEETNIYGNILFVALAMTFFEILSAIVFNIYFGTIFYNVIAKMVLLCYITVNYLFCKYLMTVCKRTKNSFVILHILTLIILILLIVSKTSYVESNGFVTPKGLPILLSYGYAIGLGIYQLILALINRKTNIGKKFAPFYLFLFFGAINTLIIYFYPTSFMVGYIWCLTIIIMYFTIENPDIKIIELEKKAAEAAQSASEAKTAFLSSMSHELRTPLNAIVGLSEDIMAYKDQVPEEVREDSEDIVNASDTLLEIVGNILDINKIEGGKLELVETDYNPKHEFESLVKIMRTKIKEKPLEFNTDIDEGLPEALYGDRLRIKQVINNFLSNAIKYTDEGKIDFSVKWISPIESLQIIVSDTGRGIKEEDKGKLFEKFERLQVEKVSSVQGTGLGLSITKNLVELMGGQIHVESEYGKGSTFSVTIPQKLGDVSKLEELDTEKQVKSAADYTGKKILVVDDNSLNIKVLKKALKPFNFDLDECYDGKSAIDKIKQNNYDVVLMDIMMPGMTGEEALSILKKDPEFKTPIIALTADATTGAKEKYLSDGFADYLAKPFTRNVIASKLEKILK